MKDIPVFTSEHGVASLILNEIPYRQEAYVIVRGVFGSLTKLLAHCADFCRAAGAQAVFAHAQDALDYPVHARLMERSVSRRTLPGSTLTLQAVTQDTARQWADAYNRCFRSVVASKPCTPQEALTSLGEASFVCEEGKRIGLGAVRKSQLLAIAAFVPGRGADVLCALTKQMQTITLLCAVENVRAMRLYDSLGFSRGDIRKTWYRID